LGIGGIGSLSVIVYFLRVVFKKSSDIARLRVCNHRRGVAGLVYGGGTQKKAWRERVVSEAIIIAAVLCITVFGSARGVKTGCGDWAKARRII
jgi:hypothetical protein